jgi:HSP20 family protein
MTKSNKIVRKEGRQVRHLDDVFENFRREMEDAIKPWSFGFKLPSMFDGETRVPLCDMADKGDRYELQVEVPGIERERIEINATDHSVEIAAEKSEKTSEKRKDYVYSERSQKSFYRRIPVPEEIVPSKVDAKMNNGILVIKLPKKSPSKAQTTKVEVK